MEPFLHARNHRGRQIGLRPDEIRHSSDGRGINTRLRYLERCSRGPFAIYGTNANILLARETKRGGLCSTPTYFYLLFSQAKSFQSPATHRVAAILSVVVETPLTKFTGGRVRLVRLIKPSQKSTMNFSMTTRRTFGARRFSPDGFWRAKEDGYEFPLCYQRKNCDVHWVVGSRTYPAVCEGFQRYKRGSLPFQRTRGRKQRERRRSRATRLRASLMHFLSIPFFPLVSRARRRACRCSWCFFVFFVSL